MPSQKPWRIVVAEELSAEAVARLAEIGQIDHLTSCDETHLLEAVGACDALLVRTSAKVTGRVLESAPHLRVVGRAGVGLDNIDVETARHRGVAVVYTPTASTEAVADLAFALMLGLTWSLKPGDDAIRAGQFLRARTSARPRELGGLTLGIVGMGKIGRAVARRAVHGFLMKVIYNDIVEPQADLGFEAARVEKDVLYANSDVVSLHVPLTNSTRSMVDERALSRFVPGALLVNTSRGAVVDALALDAALRSGRVGGAGLDVFNPEPLPPDHPLLTAPNTLFSPHVGARTARAQEKMNAVVEDVIRVLRGEPPHFPA